MHVVIKHLAGPELGRRDVLPPGRILIGRDEDSDVPFEPSRDLEVSGQHCEILPDGKGGYRIRDLGSTNGTYVNGVETPEGPLRFGDEIELGFGGPRLRFDARRGIAARLFRPIFRFIFRR